MTNLGRILLDLLRFYSAFAHESTGIYTCLPNRMPEKNYYYANNIF